ncbi:MAG: hypothetical protein COB67_02560 [SAR324 cluster bacterium]|uniref:Uncharacterized protein n=1 Tax=SAR324 cluster bacterium TaxID=2024889 RepID=A0A2A4TB29_9DELT|nr:MAG: hypothetical protein COB67_02560 [SAR324 cluster bacterium]
MIDFKDNNTSKSKKDLLIIMITSLTLIGVVITMKYFNLSFSQHTYLEIILLGIIVIPTSFIFIKYLDKLLEYFLNNKQQ